MSISIKNITIKALMALALLCVPVLANAATQNFSFIGNFAQDNSVQLFNFTVGAASSNVVLRTWSYAGGVNAAGQTIARGGFDPILAVFDSAGTFIGQNDDGGSAVPADAVTGSHYDTYLNLGALAAGSYTAAVMQYDNFALGPNLTNGFRHDAAGDVWFTRTLGANSHSTGGFYDVTTNERDSHWAFDILNVESAVTPPVTPSAITIGPDSPVFTGGSQSNLVRICLPSGSTISKVDVCLLLDDTGSFATYVTTLTNIFASLVTNLQASVPGVDFGFGVSRFEDFGGLGATFSADYPTARPFILNQPIVTAATAGGDAALVGLINAALSHTAPGMGGDGPEASLIEGLYQIAVGTGFDEDGNGSPLDSGPAGALATQLSPGTSGDVPPFASNVLPTSGTLGGVGFRSDALHIVLLASDVCPVAAFPAGQPIPAYITNAFGLSIPSSAFACSTTVGSGRFGYISDAKTTVSNTVAGAVAPSGSGSVQGTVNALNALGVRVMAMGPGAAPTTNTAATSAPSDWFSAVARMTGAVDASGVPLVFSTSVDLSTLAAAIVNSISNTTTLPISITLASPDLPAGLGGSFMPAVIPNVMPGGCASFEVWFTRSGTVAAGGFNLDFVAVGSGSVLGTIPVTVIPPPTATAPVVVAKASITVSNDAGLCSATVTGAEVDNGSYSPQGGPLTFTLTPPAPYPLGSNWVTFTATDVNGLSTSVSNVLIFVVDAEAPILVCSSNKVVECGAAWDFDAPAAFDNCSATNVVLSVDSTVTNAGCGETFIATRTWLASDPWGNSSTCSQTVTIVDTTPPTVVCPAPITIEFQDATGAVAYYVVSASDTCSSVSLAVTPASGSRFPIGVTSVQALAVDACGNSNQCIFTVNVLGAQGVKSNVLTELIAYRTSANPGQPFAQMFDEAILHLQNSLNPAYWIDQTHLQPKGGNTAMNEEKLAVNKLGVIMDSKHCPVDPATLKGFIDRIVRSDRLLAIISIQEAEIAGLNAKKIAEDLAEVAKGDEEIAAEHYANGIEHYRNAWRHALQLRLQVSMDSDGTTQVRFVGNNGKSYLIEMSSDMVNWVPVGTCREDAEGNVQFSDPSVTTQSFRFYRAVEQ